MPTPSQKLVQCSGNVEVKKVPTVCFRLSRAPPSSRASESAWPILSPKPRAPRPPIPAPTRAPTPVPTTGTTVPTAAPAAAPAPTMPILVPPLEYSFCASLPVVWAPRYRFLTPAPMPRRPRMPPRMLAPPAAAVPAAVVAWLPRAVPTVPRVPPTPPVTEVRVPSALIVAWVDPFCRNLPSQLFAEVRPFAGSVAGSISTAVPSKVALPSPRSLVAPGRAPAVAGVPALGISAPPLTSEGLPVPPEKAASAAWRALEPASAPKLPDFKTTIWAVTFITAAEVLKELPMEGIPKEPAPVPVPPPRPSAAVRLRSLE